MSQGDLFSNNIPKEGSDDFLHRQLIKLGDMMGDGLHHEEPWISKEYARIAKILHPDIYALQRKNKRDAVDKKMAELIEKNICHCGGRLHQKKKGTKVAYCMLCGVKYIISSKKK